MGLGGSLPLELVLLTQLQRLELQSNYLGGSIPVSIGLMTELQAVSVISSISIMITSQLIGNNFVGIVFRDLKI